MTAAAPAAAQVVVRPARIEAHVQDGTRLPPIEVSNRGDGPVRILAYTGFGGHDLRGMPVYRDDPAARAESARYVRLDAAEVRLAPGETTFLQATVHVPEGYRGGLYPVLFLEVVPLDPQDVAGVQTVARVAVIMLLSAGAGEARVYVEDAAVRPGSGGLLEVAVRLRNGGDVHALAGGTVTIVDASGEPVARVPLAAATVLPGAARELVAHWQPPRAAVGPYVAMVQVEEPVPIPPLEIAFTLDPAPALAGAGGAGW